MSCRESCASVAECGSSTEFCLMAIKPTNIIETDQENTVDKKRNPPFSLHK